MTPVKNWNTNYPILLIVAVIIGVSILSIYDRELKEEYYTQIHSDLDSSARKVSSSLTAKYTSFRDSTKFLYTTPPIQGIVRATNSNGIDPLDGTSTQQWKKRLTKIFIGFLENNSDFYQLRVLDAGGMEIVRVHRMGRKMLEVKPNDLQNKSGRYYFQEVRKLKEGQFFVSVADLNKEYGALTFPYQPTVRLAIPIFDESNVFFGTLIANVDILNMLKSIDLLVQNAMQITITDTDGYFVKHSNEELAYSRNLAPDKTILSEYETVDSSELFDLHRYRYTKDGSVSVGRRYTLHVAESEQGGKYYLHLWFPEQYINAELFDKRLQVYLAISAVLLVAGILVVYFYQNSRRNQFLARRHAESQAIIDVSTDAIITIDNEHRIINCNRSVERIFQVPTTNITGLKLDKLFKHRVNVDFSQKLEAFEKGDIVSNFDFSYVPDSQSQDKYYFTCVISRITVARANAKYALTISDKTNEQLAKIRIEEANFELEEKVKERTQELKQAHEKALEASKTKSMFISNISHEMRTPLNGIVGATTLMKRESHSPKMIELISMTEVSVNSLKTLINDVLDLSKIEAGKLELNYEHFSLETWLESLAATYALMANEKNIKFYLDLSGLHFSKMHSDSHRLSQVINNLVNNAIKFTSNGYVSLTVRSEVDDTNKGWLVLNIKDTGMGISEKDIKKLFRAFTQVDETISQQYGGTGLGLSICKQLVELLGGTIDVKSILDKETIFSVRIPTTEWQIEPQNREHALTEINAVLDMDRKPLRATIYNQIVASGGTATETAPHIDELEGVTHYLISDDNLNFDSFLNQWKSLNDKGLTLPKLLIIKSNADEFIQDMPKNSVVLAEPAFKSSLLVALSEDETSIVDESIIKDEHLDIESLKNKNCQILIVDDNDINIQVAKSILDELPIKIESASDGKNALEVIKSFNRKNKVFDCILMDCNMPNLNGYETTKSLRAGGLGEHYRKAPIIAMTANVLQGEKEKCTNAGMDDFITKPVDMNLLIKKVTFWLNRNETDDVIQEDSPAQETEQNIEYLDWNKEAVTQRLGNNYELLCKLITLFLSSLPGKLEEINDAIDSDDGEQLKFCAHSLKGTAANLGAERLALKLKELEDAVPRKSKQLNKDLMSEIVKLSKRITPILEGFTLENTHGRKSG